MWLLTLLLLLFVTVARSCKEPCSCEVHRAVHRDDYFYIRLIEVTTANCSDGALTHPPALIGQNIIKVILANNQIKELHEFSFGKSSYEDTIYLDLSNNLISSVDTLTFIHFDYIKDINLNNNRLSSLPPDVFMTNRHLTSLHLSGNPITLPIDEPFLTSPSLEFFIFSNCSLTTIYLQSFKGLPQVHSLDISENKLGVVNVSVFSSLEKLIQLDIYGNPNLKLEGRNNLTVDTLMMGNACSWLKDQDAYLGVPSVRQIHLDGCALEEFPASSLSTIKELHFLDLSNNRISSWEETGEVVKNLLRLNLHGNNIASLHKDAFSKSLDLIYLNISNNPLDVAPDGSFLNIPSLVNLDMSNCHVTQLNGLTFSNMINLVSINLSNNKIKKIHEDVFSGLENLTKILLADNGLLFLDKNAFIENYELIMLDLSRNPLLIPASNSLLVSKSLQLILLREMKLLNFAYLLHDIPNLKIVDVSGNNISTIQLSDITVMQKLQQIFLNNNPLLCDAKMQKVYFWTKQQNISVEARCLHPKGNWMLLEHLHFSENETHEETGKNKQNSENSSQDSSSVPDTLPLANTADTDSKGLGGGSIAAILISGVVIGAIIGTVLMVLFGKRFFIYGGFSSVRLHNVDSLED